MHLDNQERYNCIFRGKAVHVIGLLRRIKATVREWLDCIKEGSEVKRRHSVTEHFLHWEATITGDQKDSCCIHYNMEQQGNN
ncbi:hypothetical protein FRX31_024084 [Thalictrum thalictroides]|uniref:Uncharacterized protein n=1 Tax=Thalictrum thalictroides TaxID=46969 RepID=A0A7J6VQ72_THATH|nr:hypothetical protein FRX31_024084 [Thalictrum thalictroides]